MEFPSLEVLWNEYRDAGVVVIGVNTEDPVDVVQAFVDDRGLTFPIGWDQTGSYAQLRDGAAGISPFPVDVIIRPDGTIAYLSREWDLDAMRAVLDAL